MAINQMAQELDRDYQEMVARNHAGLMAATGTGGDALIQSGRNLGSALAAAGVYNSSATAGALAQQQHDLQSNLTDLANRNAYDQSSLLNANRRYVTGMRYNLANQDYGQALNDQSAARNGLASFLGSLSQFNLWKTGAPNARNQGVAMNGNQNSVLPSITPKWADSPNDPYWWKPGSGLALPTASMFGTA